MLYSIRLFVVMYCLSASAMALAHDTWVQTSATIVRPDDVVHVDFGLGNHGNDHRDFKFASKLSSLDGVSLTVVSPVGKSTDVASQLVDLGYAAKEGYWSARYIPSEEGLHCVAHKLDKLHVTTRAIKSSKTYFLASKSLDKLPQPTADHAKPLGHPLELVLESHPVLNAGPGKEVAVKLLFQGKPLADQRVSFIPRGAQLAADFDPNYERKTDAEGRCRYTPKEGNFVLVVAHLPAPEEKGEGYEKTHYAATLVLNIPQRCSCCE
jgi:uncharacterized GH25 family protein